MSETAELTWIRMVEIKDTGKTKVWNVMEKGNDGRLGQIKWFGRWRKYAFFPVAPTVFEATCLMEIAGFCKEQTDAWRAGKKGGQ